MHLRVCYTAGMIFDTTTLPDWAWFLAIPLLIWTLFWKGLALWHSARKGSSVWFVIILLVNTLGILEIVYLMMTGKLNTSALFKK